MWSQLSLNLKPFFPYFLHTIVGRSTSIRKNNRYAGVVTMAFCNIKTCDFFNDSHLAYLQCSTKYLYRSKEIKRNLTGSGNFDIFFYKIFEEYAHSFFSVREMSSHSFVIFQIFPHWSSSTCRQFATICIMRIN